VDTERVVPHLVFWENADLLEKRMSDSLKTEPKIGYYYAFCCACDLARVEDAEDVEDIKALQADKDMGCRVWATAEEARTELLANGDEPEIIERKLAT